MVETSPAAVGRRTNKLVWVLAILLVLALGAVALLLVRGGDLSSLNPANFFRSTGAWQITDEKSELDGARTYRALLQSDGTLPNVIGQPEHAVLGVECGKSGLTVGVAWPALVQANSLLDPHSTVGWKADSGEVHREAWMAAGKMTAAKADTAGALLRAWSNARKVVISAPSDGGDQEATFSVSGISDIAHTIGGIQCG